MVLVNKDHECYSFSISFFSNLYVRLVYSNLSKSGGHFPHLFFCCVRTIENGLSSLLFFLSQVNLVTMETMRILKEAISTHELNDIDVPKCSCSTTFFYDTFFFSDLYYYYDCRCHDHITGKLYRMLFLFGKGDMVRAMVVKIPTPSSIGACIQTNKNF